MAKDLPSLEGDIATVEAMLSRMQAAPPGSVSPQLWNDSVDVLEKCREELSVAESQIRFHRLEVAAWRAGEYRTSPWTSRVLDRLPVPVLSLTDTGNVVYANRAAARMLGTDTARILGKPFAVHVHLDHRLVYRAAWNRALRSASAGRTGDQEHETAWDRDGVTIAEVVLRTRHGAASWRRLVIVPEDDGGRVRVMALPVDHVIDTGIDGGDVQVSRGLAAIAQLPTAVEDETELLRQALLHAVTMPGTVAASYAESRGGVPVPLVASSAAGFGVEALQHEVGEGPGLDALRAGRAVASDDLAADARWSALGARAAALGYRAVVAVPVTVTGDPAQPPVRGVVTLWGPTVGSVPAGMIPLAGAVAETVAAALGVRRRLDALTAALHSKDDLVPTP